MKHYFLLIFALLLFVESASSQSKSKKSELFSVNKRPVYADEFVYLYEKNHKGKQEEFTIEKIEEYLQLYIKFKLKVEEARQRKMDGTDKFVKELTGYKEALRKPYLPDNKLVDSLSQLTYERLKEEIKASHILIRVQPDASPADTLKAFTTLLELKKRAESGEDFGTLALNHSEDPSAKSNEGSLGYFTALQMVYPFETGAYSTSVGAISNPIRTRFGYHLIKVTDRKASRGEVEVSHILIRSGKDRDNEAAKKLVYEVYDRLQGGMKWDEVCKQYSEDQSSKEEGGKLRAFGVGAMSTVPEFEKAAFGLIEEGSYTEPFSSQYGWHIVKLNKKIPMPAYKEMETTLKNRVSRDERMQTAKQAIQKSLRVKYSYAEKSNIKKKVMEMADSSLQRAKWKAPTGSLDDEILFTLQKREVRCKEFFNYVLNKQVGNAYAPAVYLNQLYDNFVNASIEDLVEENLLLTNSDYRYLSNEYYEGILLFDIMEKEVWNKASEDSLGQQRYFEKHINKYTAGERAEAIIFSSPKAELMEEIKQYLEKDSLLSEEDMRKKGIRMEKGRFEKNERAVLTSITWAPGISLSQKEGNYYLVKINKILPPGNRTFEEARGLLISDYQNSLEEDWLTELRKKYAVKINGKGKKYVFEKLLKQ